MKKTTKITLMSVLIIALCVSLIAGATFALFTSDVHSDVVVTSGSVQLKAEVALDSAWSALWDDEAGVYGKQLATKTGANTATLATGATATYGDGSLELDRIAPGDGAQLSIALSNLSTVFIKYRVEVSALADDGLMEALTFDCALDGEAISFTGINPRLSGWTETTTVSDGKTGASLGTLTVKVELPMDTDNSYQGKSCKLQVKVFAVQANAYIDDNVALDKTLLTNVVETANSLGYSTDTVVFGSWNTYAKEIGATYDDGIAITADGFSVKLFSANNKLYVIAYGSIVAPATVEQYMFENTSFKHIVLSDMDFSETTSIAYMFANRSSTNSSLLESVDFSGANLSGVTSYATMRDMFKNCKSLDKVDFSGADMSNVQNLPMFSNSGLREVDFSNANLSSLEKLTDAFINCTNLQTVDFSYANLSSVTEAGSANATVYGGGVFYGCTSLEMVTFAHATTSSSWTSMQNMFSYSGIKEFVLADMFEGCDLSGVTNMQKMFFECEQLTTVDLNHAYLPALTSMQQMFAMNDMQGTVSSLQTVDFSYADLSAVTTVQSMLLRCGALEELNFTHVNFAQVADFQKIFGTTAYIGYNDWRQIASLRTIDLSYANLSSVTTLVENLSSSLFGVFSPCPNLEKIDLSHADLSSLTTVMNMFYGRVDSSRQYSATSLKEIDFSYADLSSLETTGTSSNSTYSMFNGCTALETVDFTGAILSNLKDTSNMFYKCSSLVTVCLWRNQDLSMLTTAKKMFGMCQKLEHIYVETEIDLSDTLTESAGMFYACFKLSNMSSNVGSSTAQYAQYAKTGDGGCFTVIER